MIVRFTNALGEVNYGIIISRADNGMVEVVFDDFNELIARLEATGKPPKTFALRSLRMHASWIRIDAPRPYGATMKILLNDWPVIWNRPEMAGVVAAPTG